MSINLETALKTHQIHFVPVVLKLKPQHTISCAATSIIQAKPPLWISHLYDLENIPISFSTVNDINLISFLLFGDDKFDDAKNRKIVVNF